MASRSRPDPGATERIIIGRHPVTEALSAGAPVRHLYVTDASERAPWFEAVARLATARGLAMNWVGREQLDDLAAGSAHQGIAAVLEPLRLVEPEELLARSAEQNEALLVIALDTVQDPQNAGALLRTADIVGAHGMILPERRAAGFGPGVEKSSAGALSYLPVCRVTNLVRTLRWFQEHRVWVVGLDGAAPKRFDRIDLARPIVIVVGGEEKGLRHLVRTTCDDLVRLPMRGHVGSLNAAVAGSIVLYEAWRARSFPGARV